MDTVNYTDLIEKYNKNREKIELPKSEYKTIYGENIKGAMFRGTFYSKSEYEKMIEQENDTIEKRIKELDKRIEQEN